MSVIKWNRWNPIYPSLLDEDFWPSNIFDGDTKTGINIYETDISIVVEAQVPGISEDDVHVTIEDNILTISAEHKEDEEKKKKKKVIYKSTRQSSFHYSTTLPRKVKAEKAEADVENGVVTITIPIVEEEKPRRIKVNNKKKS